MSRWNEESTTVGEIKRTVGEFVDVRSWGQAHSPKNLSMSIAIEAAELMEIFQWVPSESAREYSSDPTVLEHIKEEVSDVVIYCLSLSRALGFDLAEAVQSKIAKNGVKYPVVR